MLVHLLHRPLTDCAPLAGDLVTTWGQGLRSAGETVLTDSAATDPTLAFEAAVASAAGEFAALWSSGPAPCVIHSFGAVATAAALRVGPPAPLLATFHESATASELEADLATQVDAVVSLSGQEHHRWERGGVRSAFPGPLPVPVSVPDRDACADPDGDVVTLSAGADLDELLASMRFWSGRLTVLAPMSACRRAQIKRTTASLGLTGRVQLKSGAAGPARARVWSRAALVVVGMQDSQHALPVLEAAAHGVPALARNLGASRDLIVSGTTGLLIDPAGGAEGYEPDPWTLGHALASMLGEPFWIRALGTAAMVRMSTAHAPATCAAQIGELYARVLAGPQVIRECRASDTRNRLPAQRDALVLEHLPMARQLAGWYAGRGQSSDDLVQVASMGLVRAAARFDPSQGREFHSFAIPTILGELRKHFRDNAWAVRVPRGLQETTLQVQRAAESLSQVMGRPPTVSELADHLGVVEEEVRLALQTDGEARFARSLDAPVESESFGALIGQEDDALEAIELRHDVRSAIAQLPAREQEILLLRFFGERTQVEISELLGISQVHVSRVLSRTLAAIRDHVMYDVPLPRRGEHAPAQPAQPALAS